MTWTDATGADVTVSSKPSSVVSPNPSAAQRTWGIGAKDTAVGVTKFASNLEGAEEKTNISTAGYAVSNEKVVGFVGFALSLGVRRRSH